MNIQPINLRWNIFFLLILVILFPLSSLGETLSKVEKKWLSDHKNKVFRYIIPPKYTPISFVKNGKPNGVVSEYINVLENNLGIKTQLIDVPWPVGLKMIQNKEIDFIPCISFTEEREKYLKFTENAYLSLPIVLITRKDVKSIRRLSDIRKSKVAVDINQVAYSKLKRDYQHLELEYVFRKTSPNVIKAVHLGEADFAFASAAVAGYLISQNGWTNLKIAAETDWPDTNLKMAVRDDWPILTRILEKTLQSIPRETREAVFNKWVPVRFEHGLQESVILNVIVPIIGVSILIISILITLFIWISLKRNKAITAKVKIELETQQNLLDLVVNSIPDIIFVKDTHGIYLECNTAFSTFVGQEKSDIVGKSDLQLFDKEVADLFRFQDQQLLKGRRSRRDEEWVKRSDGTNLLLDTLKIPFIDSKGQLKGLIGFSHDITDRKQAEEKLKQSQQQLKSLFEALPVGVVMIDPTGKIREANSISEHVLGLSADEHKMLDLQSEVWQIIRPDGTEMPVEEYPASRSLSGEGIVKNVEMGVNRPDGSLVWINASAAPISENASDGVAVAFEDITERKQFELDLKKLSQAVEQSPVSIVITDQHGTIEYVNPKFCEITGYSEAEVMGQNPRILKSGKSSPESYQEMWETIKGGNSWDGEFYNKKKNGELYWESASISPIKSATGTITHFLAVKQDITKNKSIEEALHHANFMNDSALDLTKSGYWHIDYSDPDYYISSKRAAAIFGEEENPDYRYHLTDEWYSRIAAVDPKIAEETGKNYAMAVEGRIPRYDTIYPYKRPIDGKVAWIRATGNIKRDNEGNALHMYGVSQDITEQKKAEEKLQLQLKELDEAQSAMLNMMEDLDEEKEKAEEATKAKSDFLANMSHEIRTPMNAILGMTHLCLQTELSRKQHDYLKKVYGSANSLLGIINDILDFSKIEAGKLDMEKIDFYLDDVLDNVSTVISAKTHDKKLEFLIQSPPNIPKFLIGDPLRVGQILINLSNNAVKFTADGEVVISVSVMEETPAQTTLKFTVRDTGIGLNEEQIGKLFKSFSQADTSTTRKFGGTGLGLAISKRLVNMMKGEIWVESEPGKGSSFIFTATFERQSFKEKKELALAEELKGLRVLVVDDNETARQIFQEILNSFNFEVELAFTGGKAIDAITSTTNPFDLIIMDWKMPGLNGIETTLQIQHNLSLPKIPKILMCTSYGREELIQQADEIGLDGFLIKPINPSVLLDTILEVFGKSPMGERSMSVQNLDGIYGLDNIRGARILLVEDNEINQQVAQELLEGQGFYVDIAENGKEGAEKALANQYDVILMDIQMPIMSGYESTEMIRKEKDLTELPIIAMTANAMVGDREKALSVGMDDHIAKPIDPKKLYSTLIKWIKPDKIENQSWPDGMVEKQDEAQITEINFPQSEYINFKDGLERVNQNKKLYLNLLKKFKANNQGILLEIRTHLQQKDQETAERLSHTLKGVAGNLGATDLFQSTKNLDDFLKQNNYKSEEFEEKIAIVENDLAQVLGLIDQVFNLNQHQQTSNQGEIDIEKVKTILQKLKQQLEDYDSDAINNFEKLSLELGSNAFEMNLDDLEKKIEQYDFEGAVKMIDKIDLSTL